MEKYLEGNNDNWYDIPQNVVGELVNPISGKVVSNDDNKAKIFYFLKGTESISQVSNLETTFKEENNIEKK